MKILSPEQIRRVDAYTIENEPVKSIDLMERAARKLFDWIVRHFRNREFVIIAGGGNNGGDGMALSRMLTLVNIKNDLFILGDNRLMSNDTKENFERLDLHESNLHYLSEDNLIQLSSLSNEKVIVDALWGTGLNRPITGFALEVIRVINNSGCKVISIDIPSGLFVNDTSMNNRDGIVKADYTLSFQLPKLSFLFPENWNYVGEWKLLNIKLSKKAIEDESTNNFYVTDSVVKQLYVKRDKFSHKGTYGHALLIAGSYGKIGAAILASKGCLRGGVGLLTTHVPHWGYMVLQTAVPEAMVSIDRTEMIFSEYPDITAFNAIGVGPGIGKEKNTENALLDLINHIENKALVLDADALNILATQKEYLKRLPVQTILTPHPKEFERLVGKWSNDFEKLKLLRNFAIENSVVCLLKGAHTIVAFPDGTCWFNSTGNPGMATAGSGDVLTGCLLALLAQGYSAQDAALLGVYLHGLAGDLAAQNISMEGMTAEDIIFYLGRSFKLI